MWGLCSFGGLGFEVVLSEICSTFIRVESDIYLRYIQEFLGDYLLYPDRYLRYFANYMGKYGISRIN